MLGEHVWSPEEWLGINGVVSLPIEWNELYLYAWTWEGAAGVVKFEREREREICGSKATCTINT